MEFANPTNGQPIVDAATLRRFLLGTLKDKAVLDRLERELLVNPEFGELVSVAEGSLIEEYLDGQLSVEEARQFETVFLAAAERRQQVRLISRLRQLSSGDPPDSTDGTIDQSSKPWTSSIFRLGLISVVLIGVGVTAWLWIARPSESDQGIVALSEAYKDQRPIQSRVTALPDYRPFNETRGSAIRAADPVARDRAERLLLDGVANSGSATAHHDLATLYLVDKKYDQALTELDAALKLAPKDATVEADLGAVYLEKARSTSDEADSLRLTDKSLEHLDAALVLDPKLKEALYNKALCLQLASSTEEAKRAWSAYLAVDPNSKWADEARTNLEQLGQNGSPKERSADDIERLFIDAMLSHDDQKANDLLTGNHELVKEKYLPLRLATVYSKSDVQSRNQGLEALKYAARMEHQRTGDEFAGVLANYYSGVRPETLSQLTEAHKALSAGFGHCMVSEYAPAQAEFKKAHAIFIRTNDQPEAQLAKYLIAYTLVNDGKGLEARADLNEVRASATHHNYRWLEAISTFWAAGSYEKAGEHSQASQLFRASLASAEKIGDRFTAQRDLLELAKLTSVTGQTSESLKYIAEILRDSSQNVTSPRQSYRNREASFQMLTDAGLHHLAKTVALDSVTTADAIGDTVWMSESRDLAAYALARAGDFEKSESLLTEAGAKIQLINDPPTSGGVDAFSHLIRAEILSLKGDFASAERSYRFAAEYYDGRDSPYYRQRAHLGLLKSLKGLNRADQLESQIPKTIAIIESARHQIRDEQERGGFLDTNENVYDIAADFEFGRENYDRALTYAESSSARSLLDWLEKGGSSDASEHPIFATDEVAHPLTIDEIRSNLPGDSQIIKYSVLQDKLLIWLISKNQFVAASVPISEDDLTAKLSSYQKLISSDPAERDKDRGKLGAELFQILLAPMEGKLDPEKRLCIIPSKELFGFPFAALPTPSSSWLIEKYQLLYAPSISVLLHCTKAAGDRLRTSAETLLAVGDPAFDNGAFTELPRLPNAAHEVVNVASAYGHARILTGQEATKKEFLADLKRADVVHFAGHYVVSNVSPGSSFMLLAKSGAEPAAAKLTNEELLKEHLTKTRLIVLAACRSGVESSSAGEGLIGLSRTFLAGGVPLVVGTQWDVNSEATARLMQNFHTLRRKGHLPTAEALRKAQMEFASDPTGRFNDPYYWAGFLAIGGLTDF